MKADRKLNKIAKKLSESKFLSGWLGKGRGCSLMMVSQQNVVLSFPYKSGVTFFIYATINNDTPSLLLLRLVEKVLNCEGFNLFMFLSKFRKRPSYLINYKKDVSLQLFFPTLKTLEIVVLFRGEAVRRFYIRNLGNVVHRLPLILLFCDALSL